MANNFISFKKITLTSGQTIQNWLDSYYYPNIGSMPTYTRFTFYNASGDIVGEYINDKPVTTELTKQMVEDVLTGTINSHTHTFSSLASKPTTVAGYGITNLIDDTQTYRGLLDKEGTSTSWIRTPQSGLLPYSVDGFSTSRLGTSAWPFISAHIKTIFENGTSLADKYAAISHTHTINQISDSTMLGQNLVKLANGSAISFPRFNADNTVSKLDAAAFRTAIGAGTSSTIGTVTSVGLSLPNIFSVTNSPVTSSGTLTGTLVSQNAKTFLAAPNAANGVPSFREIVASDIPTLNQNTTGSAATLTTSRTIGLGTGVTSTATAFNGSSNITIPVTGIYEGYLDWGNRSLAGNVTPIGMSLSNEHSANRTAFINGDALTFEYSSDSGLTWTDYGFSSELKSRVFTTAYSLQVGRPLSTDEYTLQSRTRITLTAQNGVNSYLYTSPRKMLINVSISGGMQVLVEYRTGANYLTNGEWLTFGTYVVGGWSGWNDIPLVMSTLGGGANQTANAWQLRLTFIITSVNAAAPTAASVNQIRIYGSNAWVVPSTMANTGHLYTFDMSQNATFPAGVTANGGIANHGAHLLTRAQPSSAAATQIPVFLSDPSAAAKAIYTRTPSQLLSDIGGLPLSGGTLTGQLITVEGQFADDRISAGINLRNSNIIGANSIYFADLSEGPGEGIQFYRGVNTVDSLWANNGVLKFTPNRTLGSAATDYNIYHTGNKPTLAEIGAAAASHNHDDRYFTETEVTNLLAAKAPLYRPFFSDYIQTPRIILHNSIQNYNAFTSYKIPDSVNTNILAGKWKKLKMTWDGVENATMAQQLTNLNYEGSTEVAKGLDGDPDHVIDIDFVTNGLYSANGVVYAGGKLVLNFYTALLPSAWSCRVKNRDGIWTAMPLTQQDSQLIGTIPISNYLTNIEITLSTGTGAPYIAGTIKWALVEIEYFANRMNIGQSALISSVGGYIGGDLEIDGLLKVSGQEVYHPGNKPTLAEIGAAAASHNHDATYVAKNATITAATKTKITYDAKGLVTAGADATLDDIADGSTRKLSNYQTTANIRTTWDTPPTNTTYPSAKLVKDTIDNLVIGTVTVVDGGTI